MPTLLAGFDNISDPTLREQLKNAFGAFSVSYTSATQTELNALHGQGAVAADFAKLHALTATAAQINTLYGVTAGTVTASKALVVGAYKNLDKLFFGTVDATGGDALILGAGVAATPITTAVAGKSFGQFYTQSTDTGDNNRGFYWKHTLKGAGISGEAMRPYVLVNGVAAANARGVYATAEIDTTGSVTGSCYGISSNLMIDAASRVLGGTLACLDLTGYVGTGITLPASHGFIHCSDADAVAITNLFHLDAVSTGAKSNSALLSTGIGVSSGMAVNTAIKIRANGVTYWLLASTTQPSATS